MSISVVKGKCVFPNMEQSRDKRFTITKPEIIEMKKLRKEGLSYDKIAELINRQTNVVKAYLQKDYSKKFAKYTGKCNKNRYKNDERFRTLQKQSVKENQNRRYKEDIEYRIYNSCRGRCAVLKKNYGSLEKYREYRLKLFKYEKDPLISREKYLELRRNLRKKYLKVLRRKKE